MSELELGSRVALDGIKPVFKIVGFESEDGVNGAICQRFDKYDRLDSHWFPLEALKLLDETQETIEEKIRRNPSWTLAMLQLCVDSLPHEYLDEACEIIKGDPAWKSGLMED